MSAEDVGYSEALLSHFLSDEGVGELDAAAGNVGSGWVRSPHSLDAVRLQLAVVESQVVASRFKAHGDAPVIAAAAWVCRAAQGQCLDALMRLQSQEVAEALAIPPLKIHASVLAVRALQAAIADYRRKSGR